jgi:hypothetical protein
MTPSKVTQQSSLVGREILPISVALDVRMQGLDPSLNSLPLLASDLNPLPHQHSLKLELLLALLHKMSKAGIAPALHRGLSAV